jgi:hypothetical protein
VKKIILNLCLIVGLLVFLVYRILSHFMQISDAYAIPMCRISIILMLIGIAYKGWCFGKRMKI